MRVIAGSLKGRRLVAPDTPGTRPVADRVKEAVFSSLGEEVREARVLDLFAGAGSFGIEAYSRGARSVVFVESGRAAVSALRRNLAALDIPGEVFAMPVESYLKSAVGPFDIVFADPPWAMPSDDLGSTLQNLAGSLTTGGVAVVSRRSSDPRPEPDSYTIDAERRYGDTRIIRYRKVR